MRPSRRTGRAAFAAAALLLWGPVACSGARPAAPVGPLAPDPRPVAERLGAATTPGTPRQATFEWSLNEAGSRLGGRGVVRYEAPDRLRLDLFGPRGETYLAAALVDGEFRLPPNAAGVALPSASLLWAALGVAQPPAGTPLLDASASAEGVQVRYGTSASEVYSFNAVAAGDSLRLAALERVGPSGVLESVELDHSAEGALRRARYRNWTEFRELSLEMQEVTDVPSFPQSIWSPGAGGA